MKKSDSLIDSKGLRLNVGIILVNSEGKLLWGHRADKTNAWQFPQGGMKQDESPEQAMYRELHEELGLKPEDVTIMAIGKRWLHYYLPRYLRRYRSKPFCIGQKQKWFLLRLLSNESHINLNCTIPPEFDRWRWVDYWCPLQEIVIFKRDVYQRILKEFAPLLTHTK